MIIKVEVRNPAARVVAIFATLIISALLTYAMLLNFLAGVLTDQRANIRTEWLAAGIAYVPNSARLNARLAETEMTQAERDLSAVESCAQRAVNLSPWDYEHRLLMATVKEAKGDRDGAEQSLREALALAPNYPDVHWRLANLLLREGKLGKSVSEFRAAASSNPKLLPGTLDLLWRVSAGNLAALQTVAPTDPNSQAILAQFLLKEKRAADAITIFSGIDRNALVGLPQSPAFIDSLVSQGHIEEARGLWIGMISGDYAQPGHPLPLVWNGSFESDASKNLAQFDWRIIRNEYAVPSIDSSVARTGSRSLRIEFTGRDTTRLDEQVKQIVVVHPGARYRLECYARSERLNTPEGPRVVVTGPSSTEIVKSAPISPGSSDWHPIAIDFTAPANTRAIVITIRRVPQFSYDDPTSGIVWFDDFRLTEQGK
ncbi:MAG TPA: tetratricopeptide repeat protein [Blastocatellia bacterium]|nr:tetratricopeptide repeat protein [Blastocatellia bacterium]